MFQVDLDLQMMENLIFSKTFSNKIRKGWMNKLTWLF